MESLQNETPLKDIRPMQNRSFWAKAFSITLILASAVFGFQEGSHLAYLAGDAHRAWCIGLEESIDAIGNRLWAAAATPMTRHALTKLPYRPIKIGKAF